MNCSSAHYVRVNIYWICGVCYDNVLVFAEDVADVAAVALCTVAYQHFFGRNGYAEALVVACNRFTKEVVALTAVLITSECFLYAHFVSGLLHSLNYNGSQRLCNVAYTHLYNFIIGVSGNVLSYSLAYFDKKIAFLEI